MAQTIHQQELLQTAFNAVFWARASDDAHAAVRAESRLFDQCLSAGMSYDEPDHIEWAAVQIAQDLVSSQ